MTKKQSQCLQLLDQLIGNAQAMDAKINGNKLNVGESFQVHFLKILRETLVEIFNETPSLNTNMSKYGPDDGKTL